MHNFGFLFYGIWCWNEFYCLFALITTTSLVDFLVYDFGWNLFSVVNISILLWNYSIEAILLIDLKFWIN